MVTANKRKSKVTEVHSDYNKEQQLQDKVKERRRRGLIRRLIAFAVPALVLTILFISVFTSQAATIKEKQIQQKQAEEELVKLEQQEEYLKEEIKKLNNLDYIGELARRDYSMSKPGETIFKLPSSSN
ncbi:FtsB family cell division protein [Guptibacillus algicola]|uniref:FtsB family cell division protein n=1 Tax=Guptibacillus algicola TaxID=225844 RepID=UPI001CD7402B|nr:septum formation initiator family protein [Alkalihalobacillus algicola]MCA0989555.1 septum formation initiator family protein [Alkalihalobacillus algicola]